jgi:hypothetical protein
MRFVIACLFALSAVFLTAITFITFPRPTLHPSSQWNFVLLQGHVKSSKAELINHEMRFNITQWQVCYSVSPLGSQFSHCSPLKEGFKQLDYQMTWNRLIMTAEQSDSFDPQMPAYEMLGWLNVVAINAFAVAVLLAAIPNVPIWTSVVSGFVAVLSQLAALILTVGVMIKVKHSSDGRQTTQGWVDVQLGNLFYALIASMSISTFSLIVAIGNLTVEGVEPQRKQTKVTL